MKYTRYDIDDFLKLARKETTYKELATKYQTTQSAIKRAMLRADVKQKNIEVKMTTPYQTRIFSSIRECSRVIGVHRETIKRALNGEYVNILAKLDIKVEVYKKNYAEEEYDD